jgi:transposase
MSVTQDDKIRQVADNTLVVGVDIASETHWARAFDWRGLEIGKVTSFENDAAGFAHFAAWLAATAEKGKKNHVIIGAEPTGHYWFTLAVHLKSRGITLVLVNPHHVKKSKELDDNHPGKSDRKDPKTIAKLVLEGRWSAPYIPEGVYAELRVAVNLRWRIQRELTMVKNQLQRWLNIYFPEHRKVFGKFEGAASMAILKGAPLPQDLITLGVDGINAAWRKIKLRAVGKKRAKALYEAAKTSVGCVEGSAAARLELSILLEDYDAKMRQNEEVMATV